MKKILLLFSLLLISTSMFAQDYHADDMAALQLLLLQNATDGQKNYNYLGFTAEPNWKMGTWVGKVKGVTWNSESPKRITEINWTGYNDDNFKKLKGFLNISQCNRLKEINVADNQISRIEVGSGLSDLNSFFCNNTSITELDLTTLSNLKQFSCYGAPITELKLSGLNKLELVDCSETKITELNLTGLDNLKTIDCSSTLISELNVNHLTNLQSITCSKTSISELDVSNLSQLVSLYCSNTYISSLDVTNLTNLKILYCSNTNLTFETLPDRADTPYANAYVYYPLREINGGTAGKVIDLSAQNRKGKTKYMWYEEGNEIYELNLTEINGVFYIPEKYIGKTLLCFMTNSDFPMLDTWKLRYRVVIVAQPQYNDSDKSALQKFLMQNAADGQKNYNHLGFTAEPDWTSEDWVSQVAGLTWNTDAPKRMTDIDWNNKTQLKGSLDVKACKELISLSIFATAINALNVSELGKLEKINCNSTQITSLNLNGLSNLKELHCQYLAIAELNVNGLTNLKHLDCSHTTISEVNTGVLTNLTHLYISGTLISELNTAGLANLYSLNCSNTQITQLNLSGLTNLEFLYCSNTPISELDVTGLLKLQRLNCQQTNLTLSTLPPTSAVSVANQYLYAPLKEIDGGEIDGDVDLSAQNRNGNTIYRWYVDGDLTNELTDVEGADGMFNIPVTYVGQTLVCHMTNSDFPQFDANQLVYKAKVSSLLSIGNETAFADKIYVQDNCLIVEAVEAGFLQVYDTMGRMLIRKQLTAGENNFPLPGGSYITLFNGQRVKVMIR